VSCDTGAIIIVLTYNTLQTCIQKHLGTLLLVIWNGIQVIKNSALFNAAWNIIDKYHAMQMTLMYHNLLSVDHCACDTTFPIWWPFLGCTSVTQTYVNVNINLYYTFFRHICKIAKSNYWLHHACLFAVPPHWTAWLLLARYSWNLIF